MAITPSTNLYLLKVPLEIDNKNQLTFADKNTQFNYFSSLEGIEISNISYQRKDGIIRYPAHIDSILEYNYCMYQNENYTNKWFYCFITNMKYINDNMTEITIVTDVWQTWQFDLEFKQSFIEREMIAVSDDIPGANLLPEGLETGEFKVGGTAELDELETVNVIAYSGDEVPIGLGSSSVIQPINQGGYTVNGISQSIVFLIVENQWYNILMNAILKSGNYSDYIVSCFSVPKLAVSEFMVSENQLLGLYPVYALQAGNHYNQTKTTKTLINTPSQLDGYTPRNQKLRTYPYMYLGFNPTNGSSNIYRYENFEDGTPEFDIISEVNPNPSVVFIPQNYRGQSGNSLSDIATLNGYPTLSSKNDYFNSWLAQNGEIISLQMQQEQFNYYVGQFQGYMNIGQNLLGGVSNATNEGYGGVAGSAISTATGIIGMYANTINHEYYQKNLMAQIEKQKLIPDKVNLSSSNATLIGYNLIDNNIFTRYTIKAQFAERIDKFFDMYGYLTNEVKVPNLNNRPNWNYIKTIGINIHAFIPQEDLQAIKLMFDNGITLWHNKDTFLDYSQNNR